ncbi:hypothetical protein [Eubacterium aggregans]|uniref:hypothetical protein n=1 Tax=Eubacterium aggregans TaxID=81409 RepID=UPI003F2A1913
MKQKINVNKGSAQRSVLGILMGLVLLMTLELPIKAEGTLTPVDTAVLVSNLKMASSLTTKAVTMTFTFTPVKVNDDQPSSNNMPGTYTKLLTYDETDEGKTEGRTKTVKKTLSGSGRDATNLIPEIGTVAGESFTHAGVYVYRVTVAQSGSLTLSQAAYTLAVYVVNDDSGTNQLSFAGVIVKQIADDSGIAVENLKVNPVDTAKSPSAFAFTSSYSSNSTLYFRETTLGTNDYEDKTRSFHFKAILKNAGLTGQAVTAYKTANEKPTSADTVYSFVYGTENDFTLKNDDKLMFGTLEDDEGESTFVDAVIHVGTTYSITDVLNTSGDPGALKYKAKATLKSGEESKIYENASEGTDLTIPNVAVANATGQNYVAFTNTYLQVTPTGLLIDNLPYILMLALPGMVFGLYFANKKRKSRCR